MTSIINTTPENEKFFLLKRLNNTAIKGSSGDYVMEHSFPQCRQCSREIKPIGTNPESIEGFYSEEYESYLHYTCFDGINISKDINRKSKEDSIIHDVEDAIKKDKIIPQTNYSIFDEGSYKYCSYCDGLITDVLPGVSYPSNDEKNKDFHGRQFIHVYCYNTISIKIKKNLTPEVYNHFKKRGRNEVNYSEEEDKEYEEWYTNQINKKQKPEEKEEEEIKEQQQPQQQEGEIIQGEIKEQEPIVEEKQQLQEERL